MPVENSIVSMENSIVSVKNSMCMSLGAGNNFFLQEIVKTLILFDTWAGEAPKQSDILKKCGFSVKNHRKLNGNFHWL